MNSVIKLLLCVAGSYLVGNISPATLIGKAYGVDIKKVGSGNAGTTNVLRTLGYGPAALTLVIDILKGFLAVRIGLNAGNLLCGELCFLAVVLGHVYPVFFHFKGGKGIACSAGCLGVAFGIVPLVVLVIIFATVVFFSKYVSLGSVCCAVAAAIMTPVVYWGNPIAIACIFATVAVIIWAHRENIARLRSGTERKIGQRV